MRTIGLHRRIIVSTPPAAQEEANHETGRNFKDLSPKKVAKSNPSKLTRTKITQIVSEPSKPTLSRRQRKNFRKKRLKAQLSTMEVTNKGQDEEEEEEKEAVSSATSSQYSSGSSDSGVCSGNNEAKAEEEYEEEKKEDGDGLSLSRPVPYEGFNQCKQFIKLGLSESDIYFNLLNYLLTPDQLMRLSYPVDQESHMKKLKKISSDLNIAAKEFVPKSSTSVDLKTCVRCLSSFSLKDYDTDLNRKKKRNTCRYHHGKVRVSKQYGYAYTCCGESSHKIGCEVGSYHVWSDSSSVISGRGYVKTRRSNSIPFSVYSLDCEMAFTTSGMELVKITVISVDGSPVYESFVQPDSRIVDHNTRFSGVTAKDLDINSTKTLKQVQRDLLRIISSDTVLIGHALDNDFRVLRLIHDKVVDTAVLFPHFYGIPYRRSLKSLAEIYLKRSIQTSERGHDPYEDALASVELILWKMRKDLDDGLSLFV
ncbi:putative exonuclease GOR isoform X2 [Lepeophtheirus salmonis]|uniref:putative exonuclease GOR isoform X2 n=1 Tax=Lepeophtheirus salmonis TaxID=72036 RepID=UPI001AEAF130|nr:putative exonuclease GOR isoform X2 [Lepeophtheirus salmonis]